MVKANIMKQKQTNQSAGGDIFRNIASTASITIILLLIIGFVGSSLYIGITSFLSR